MGSSLIAEDETVELSCGLVWAGEDSYVAGGRDGNIPGFPVRCDDLIGERSAASS
jgi:hypothetical protein